MNIIRSLKFRVKVTIYKIILRIMQSLRIYTIGEIMHKANSPEGMRWNDLLLLRVSLNGRMATVLYCNPNKFVRLTTVPVDELITGTAYLDYVFPTGTTIPEAIKPSEGLFKKIGEFNFDDMN